MKLALSAGALALSMALAGCGGGGSSTQNAPRGANDTQLPPGETEPTTRPPQAMTHKVDLPVNTPTDGYTEPMASDTVTVAAGETEQLGSSSIQVMCPEDGDECVITVNADGEIQSSVEGAMASLTEAADKLLMAENEEIKDRIIGKDRALENPTAYTGASTIEVYRGPSASARIEVTGFGDSDTPALSNGDWAGKRLTRKTPSYTEHLVVYSDIEAPGRVQFYNFDGSAVTPQLYEDEIATRGSGGPTDVPASNTRYTSQNAIYAMALVDAGVADADLFNDDNLDSHFKSPGPAADGSKRVTFSQSAYQDGNIRFPGDFNGASGTYECEPQTGTSCQVDITPGGVYTSTGTWTFEPELNATAFRQDRVHVNFGWWLREPDSQNNAYSFQYFHNGGGTLGDYDDADGDNTLEERDPIGTATYSGRAAGHYVVQEVGDSGVTGGMHGEFTAAATLNATFGAGNNLLSGTISGFAGNHPNMSGWMVKLHERPISKTNDTQATTDWATTISTGSGLVPTSPDYEGVTATMGDETATGAWSAQYYGASSGAARPNAQPLSVGGLFQADNDKVSIAGAFGASRPTQ